MHSARMVAWIMVGIAMACLGGNRAFGEGTAGKWEESTPGRWESLPDRQVKGTDNAISVEVTMPPGSGVLYRRIGRRDADPVALSLSVDNVNMRGNDYLPTESFFPVSVTFVFGNDSLKLGMRHRIGLFFKQLWNGFTPSGIRLTYAWGNGLPVGSMYRLWEEETVFVVAGPEEIGKTISSTRRLGDDFRAAYGRPPKGKVTEVRVIARRPSREKGAVRGTITVRFPAE